MRTPSLLAPLALSVAAHAAVVALFSLQLVIKWPEPPIPIELQVHGNPLWFKNIYIKELP